MLQCGGELLVEGCQDGLAQQLVPEAGNDLAFEVEELLSGLVSLGLDRREGYLSFALSKFSSSLARSSATLSSSSAMRCEESSSSR